MWFEILPSFGIIFVAMGVPHLSAYVINKLVVGNEYRRDIGEKEMQLGYLRDWRLTNNPYKLAGLENIPDN